MKTGTTALGTALTDSANSFTAMEADVDSLFGNAGTQAGNTANALRNQATNISKQAQSYQQIMIRSTRSAQTKSCRKR